MAISHSEVLSSFQTLVDNSLESQPFSEFQKRLHRALQQAFQANVTPNEQRIKAITHAFQLYHDASLRKLAQSYQQQDTTSWAQGWLKRMEHSLSVVYALQSLAGNEEEQKSLHGYQVQLEAALEKVFNEESVYPQQKKEVHEVGEHLWQCLFSEGYQTYLMLRNRYFLTHLNSAVEHFSVKAWMHQQLKPFDSSPEDSLSTRMEGLDFQQVEALVQGMVQEFAEADFLRKQVRQLCFLEDTPTIEESILPPVVASETSETLPEAQEGLLSLENLPPVPSVPVTRDAFEELCFRQARALIYCSKHTQVVQDCSSPYFRAKNEEYLPEIPQSFQHFFDTTEVYSGLTQFITQVLEKTQPANPFEAQMDTSESPEATQLREWGILFKSRSPHRFMISQNQRSVIVEEGHPFVMHLGIALFHYGVPRKQKTMPQGYVRLLFQGRQFQDFSSVSYVDGIPYYQTTEQQFKESHKLVMLYLLALRNRLDLDFSDAMKQHWVSFFDVAQTSLN